MIDSGNKLKLFESTIYFYYLGCMIKKMSPNGLKIKSYCKWCNHAEKSTKFFDNLENHRLKL